MQGGRRERVGNDDLRSCWRLQRTLFTVRGKFVVNGTRQSGERVRLRFLAPNWKRGYNSSIHQRIELLSPIQKKGWMAIKVNRRGQNQELVGGRAVDQNADPKVRGAVQRKRDAASTIQRAASTNRSVNAGVRIGLVGFSGQCGSPHSVQRFVSAATE